MSTADDLLQFYGTPGPHTALEGEDFSSTDIAAVVSAVQGLLIYDTVCEPFYGVTLSPEQADTIHERTSTGLLAAARRIDPGPGDRNRPAGSRVGARCHAYTRLTVSFLRAARVPARSRCGFATYFLPDHFEDHWVAECWNAETERWTLVDAQLDETWRSMTGFAGDPFDLDRGEFLTAGQAWRAWRRGEIDADRCGLSSIGEFGSFWLAANLRLDLAALNKIEMLPWDVWGEGWGPGEEPNDEQLELFDHVAELTTDPDARFDALRAFYDEEDRVRMDGTVFNVLRERDEQVEGVLSNRLVSPFFCLVRRAGLLLLNRSRSCHMVELPYDHGIASGHAHT